MKLQLPVFCGSVLLLFACGRSTSTEAEAIAEPLRPDFTTDTTLVDTDDPAIWIHPENPMESLILGTDKGDYNGGVYVFDLKGKMLKDKCILNLPRPNNIDIEYGFVLGGDTIDIAVFTQRNGDNIRVLQVPEMRFIDGGGIPVFVGDTVQAPMGVGLYKRPSSGEIFAVLSRKSGPDGAYLWQYALRDSSGVVVARPVRQFGAFRGGNEIESIAVDDEEGFIYYSDEGVGIRKYHADPDSSNVELALFGREEFQEDHEGISIYSTGRRSGYILVSDQQANRFQVFDREAPHQHITAIPVSTNESDGSELSSQVFGDLYPRGFFIAMSDNRTFQIYRWEQLEQRIQAAKAGK